MGRLANKIALMQTDVHGIVVCDCGHQEFKVGVRIEGLENRIRCLVCTKCQKRMDVPFQSREQADAG